MAAVLWRSQNIFLIDIPRSISAAQGTATDPCEDVVLSSKPLQSPHPSNEPESIAGKSKILNHVESTDLHVKYHELLRNALDEVHADYRDKWCLPRRFTEEQADSSPDLKRKPEIHSRSNFHAAELDERFVHSSAPTEICQNPVTDDTSVKNMVVNLHCADGAVKCSDCNSEASIFRANCSDNSTTATSEERPPRALPEPATFRIPPRASFFLGDCMRTQDFHAAIRDQAQAHGTRRHFDFILLDPPWPNRSVRRTRKTSKSTYSTPSRLPAVADLIFRTDLDSLLARRGLVGIWITNKSAVRNLALGDNGIFATWGLVLVEEWIWLKTTIKGEPVAKLDSEWRKPYEVLLLGRKGGDAAAQASQSTDNAASRAPIRRVIIGVPDVHSRKPCLKELIEPLFFSGCDYRALEVFSRHLVAGWWSWGDECLKYNREVLWVTRPSKSL